MGHRSCGWIGNGGCEWSKEDVPSTGTGPRRQGELRVRHPYIFFISAPKPPPLPPFNAPMAEQAFLAKHYDENSKKPDRDPRGAFRNPTDTATAGIVGPLGSSSFNLPTVEKALADMEGSALNASVNGDASRRLSRGGARPAPGLPAVGGAPSTRSPTSSTLSSSQSSTGEKAQHEVLHNFFQSLLNSKDRAGASAAASRAAAAAPSLARSDGSPTTEDM